MRTEGAGMSGRRGREDEAYAAGRLAGFEDGLEAGLSECARVEARASLARLDLEELIDSFVSAASYRGTEIAGRLRAIRDRWEER
jgi:hypothetical protein